MILALSAGWLVTTAASRDWTQFFGLWGKRDLGVGLGGLWLAGFSFLRIRSPRRGLFILLFGSFLLFASLLLLELVGWVGLVSYPDLFFPPTEALGTQAIPGVKVEGETFEDLASGWGYPCEPVPFRYWTDRRGYRNEKDRDAADVYLLGDSVLVAGLIPFRETTAGRLETELQRPVMNIALIGLSPQKENEIFRAAGVPVKRRLVLHFIFEGNDLLDSRSDRQGRQGKKPPSFVHRTFSYNAAGRLQQLLQIGRLPRQRRFGFIGSQRFLFSWTRHSWEGLESEKEPIFDTIEELRSWVKEEGGEYGVVYVPAKIRVLGPFCEFPADSTLRGHEEHLSPLRGWILDWCDQQGIPILDTTQPLTDAAREGRIPWFAGDTHPNSTGHGIIADCIRSWSLLEVVFPR